MDMNDDRMLLTDYSNKKPEEREMNKTTVNKSDIFSNDFNITNEDHRKALDYAIEKYHDWIEDIETITISDWSTPVEFAKHMISLDQKSCDLSPDEWIDRYAEFTIFLDNDCDGVTVIHPEW